MYKLLIVDDDEIIRTGLSQIVPWDSMGFCVVYYCSSGKESLEYLKYNPVDVILTDIDMPEMNGLELIKRASVINPGLRSVIISGYSEFEYAKTAIELKTESYILKPISQEKIRAVFLGLKVFLDKKEADKLYRLTAPVKAEYELMRILNQKISSEFKFTAIKQDAVYCNLLVIKAEKNIEDIIEDDMFPGGITKIQNDIMIRFSVGFEKLLVLILKSYDLKNVLNQLPSVFKESGYRIAVGKEIYSDTEIVASYWSAVELLRESKKKIARYEEVQLCLKKDSMIIHELKTQMIKVIEEGKNHQIEEIINKIERILSPYDVWNICSILKEIAGQIIRYFRIKDIHNYRLLRIDEEVSITSAFLFHVFRSDIEAIIHDLKNYSEAYSKILVNKAIAIMEKNYNNSSLSLAGLAHDLNVSYAYLSTLFTKVTGKSFTLYLQELRMEKARQLLLTRNYKIYEIADMTGYSSSKYFTDVFKKSFGLTPQGYINRIGGNQ